MKKNFLTYGPDNVRYPVMMTDYSCIVMIANDIVCIWLC